MSGLLTAERVWGAFWVSGARLMFEAGWELPSDPFDASAWNRRELWVKH